MDETRHKKITHVVLANTNITKSINNNQNSSYKKPIKCYHNVTTKYRNRISLNDARQAARFSRFILKNQKYCVY